MTFLLSGGQHRGLLIVSLYSLTTVVLTVQLGTQEAISIGSASHVSQVSTESHNFGMQSSRGPRLTTLAQSVNQGSSSAQFFDTYSGKWFRWILSYMIVPFTHLISIGSNIINIMVFIKIGLRDGASILFFSLSISDMLYSSFYDTNRILHLLEYVLNQYPYLRLTHLAYLLTKCGRMFFDVSVLITVFAGLQKCACVAIPLTFRNFFTFRKSVISLVSIAVCVFVSGMPRIAVSYMAPALDRQFNRTRLSYQVVNYNLAVIWARYYKSINRVSLPIAAEIILIFCVCVMTYKLRQAAVTRQAMTSVSSEKKNTSQETKEDKTETSTGNSLSKKELRVIRSVNIICVVFIAGTLPRCLLEISDLASKETGDFSVNEELFWVLGSVQELIIGLSLAANVIVYFRFNSKYRENFQQVFGCFSGKTFNK